MGRDYEYTYEWDEMYCYPHSHVLINHLGIQDAVKLAIAEREITSVKLSMAIQSPIKGRFDLRHLQKIHQYIFGDIYKWAGKLRQVNIAKGNQFCLAQHLESYATSIFDKLQKEQYLVNAGENTPYRLSYYLGEINVLHPFREGNGRTQRLFLMYLAGVAGYYVDFSKVTPKEMIIASADSFACDYRRMDAMFEQITIPIPLVEQKKNMQYFFGKNSTLERWLSNKA